jgi:hypothetical protein
LNCLLVRLIFLKNFKISTSHPSNFL